MLAAAQPADRGGQHRNSHESAHWRIQVDDLSMRNEERLIGEEPSSEEGRRPTEQSARE